MTPKETLLAESVETASKAVKSWTDYLDAIIKADAEASIETNLEQLKRRIEKVFLAGARAGLMLGAKEANNCHSDMQRARSWSCCGTVEKAICTLAQQVTDEPEKS